MFKDLNVNGVRDLHLNDFQPSELGNGMQKGWVNRPFIGQLSEACGDLQQARKDGKQWLQTLQLFRIVCVTISTARDVGQGYMQTGHARTADEEEEWNHSVASTLFEGNRFESRQNVRRSSTQRL